MPGPVVVSPFVVRMIEAKLWTYGDELAGPPGNSNRMLGIRRGKAGARADAIVKVFVADIKKGIPRDAKSRVVEHRPFGGITIAHRKRAALKRDLVSWMTYRVFHV